MQTEIHSTQFVELEVDPAEVLAVQVSKALAQSTKGKRKSAIAKTIRAARALELLPAEQGVRSVCLGVNHNGVPTVTFILEPNRRTEDATTNAGKG